ncbi:MAG: hypothetical protein ABS40_18080 [Agrobacterium sp. SCN 61-19]|nr:MAG: hypothetical protein ABS40_18080 [Agrobacterium sp. SCN 61-19]
MQLIVVDEVQTPEHRHLLEEMWRLRARVFAGRLNWQVNSEDGLERDQFDDHSPTYILGIKDDVHVVGCVRLLPPLRSSMLREVFPELLDGRSLALHERMIESSRFCIDRSGRAGGASASIIHSRTRILLAGIVEWSLARGYDELVTATDVKFERLLKMVGWPLKRLGAPTLINETLSVAGSLAISDDVLKRLKPPGYRPLYGQLERTG